MIPTWLTRRYLIDGERFVAFRERLGYDGGMNPTEIRTALDQIHDLHEAVYACNRAIQIITNNYHENGEVEMANLISARDQIWMVGVRMFPASFRD